MSGSKAVWLVKSNGRILGPFTKDQVYEKLKSKEIVVLDEVAESFRRWRYLRDHEGFQDIVEEVRKLNFGANEDHTLTTSTAGNHTQTITENIANTQFTEDLTYDLAEDNLTEEIVINDLDEEIFDHGSTMQKRQKSPSAFVPANQARNMADQSSDWTSRALWILVIGVIFGVGGYVYYTRNLLPQDDQTTTLPIDRYKEKGLEHYYAGDYELAIPHLLKAYKQDPGDLELSNLLAPVLLQQGPRGFVTASEMIKKLRGGSPEQVTRSYVLEGLLTLKRKEIKAAEMALKKAVERDQFSWQGFTNLGVAAFLSKDYVSARNHFEAALKIELQRSTSRGEAYLMRAQSEIELWKQVKDDRYLKQAKLGIESYLNEFSDYKQEALLLKAFAEYAEQDYQAASQTIDKLIDTDPFLTEEHAKDPTVYRDTLDWAYLLERCQAIVSGMNSSAHLETLHALCLIQSKDKDIEAQEVINAAINQAPEDPLIQGVFAFVNWHLGSDMKAEMLATKAIEMNSGASTKLPHIIKARICESLENFECSLQEWKQVQSKDKQSISALAGVSVSYLNMKKFSQFETSFNNARKHSRYYKPLLRAQVKASKEGIRIRK